MGSLEQSTKPSYESPSMRSTPLVQGVPPYGQDLKGTDEPHNDALVITIMSRYVECWWMEGPLRTSSLLNIGMGESPIKGISTLLVGFAGTSVTWMHRATSHTQRRKHTSDKDCSVLGGRQVLSLQRHHRPTSPHVLQAIPSTYHQMIKYQSPRGIGQIQVEQIAMCECYTIELKGASTYATIEGELS